jgi:hypothetical protein
MDNCLADRCVFGGQPTHPGSFAFFLGAPSGKPSLSAFNYSTYYNGALDRE